VVAGQEAHQVVRQVSPLYLLLGTGPLQACRRRGEQASPDHRDSR